MADDVDIQRLTRELLLALGTRTTGGAQVTIHIDAQGLVQQLEVKTFRKLRHATGLGLPRTAAA